MDQTFQRLSDGDVTSSLLTGFSRKKPVIFLLLALAGGSSMPALAASPPSSCFDGGVSYARIITTTNNSNSTTIKNNYCYQIPVPAGGAGGYAIGAFGMNFTLPAPSKVTAIGKGGTTAKGVANAVIASRYNSNLKLDNVDVYVSGAASNGKSGNGLSGLISDINSTLTITGDINAYVDNGAIALYANTSSVLNAQKSSTINAGPGGWGIVYTNSTGTLNNLTVNTRNAFGVTVYPGSTVNLSGFLRATTTDAATSSIYVNAGTLNVNALTTVTTNGSNSHGIYAPTNGRVNLRGATTLKTAGDTAYGIYSLDKSTIDVYDLLNITTSGLNANGIALSTQSSSSFYKPVDLNINGQGSDALKLSGILVDQSSQVSFLDKLTVNIPNGTGIFVAKDSKAYLKSVTIHTTGGHGIYAGLGGYVSIQDAGVLDIQTNLATGWGFLAQNDGTGGTIDLSGSSIPLTTHTGGASFLIYSKLNFKQYVDAAGSLISLQDNAIWNISGISHSQLNAGSLIGGATINLGVKQLNLGVLSGGINDTIIKTGTVYNGTINGTGTGSININADPSFRDTYSLTLTGALNWSAPTKVESGTLIFSAPTGSALSQNVVGTNNGSLQLTNSTLFKGAMLSKTTQANDAPNMSLTSANDIWQMPRTSMTNTLSNLGQIKFSNTVPGQTLSVAKDYVGGGQITFNTTLNGDSDSPTDIMNVTGNVSGITSVFINNIDGLGAATEKGILVIKVTGTSAPDAFVLGARVRSGNYEYALVQHADGNWYLESHLMLDHYEMDFTNNGLTCNDHEVTIKACANASCSALVLEPMTVILSPNSTTAEDGKWRPYSDCSLSGDSETCLTYTEQVDGLNGTPNPTRLTFTNGVATLGLAHFAVGSTDLAIESSDYDFRWPTLSTAPLIYNCNATLDNNPSQNTSGSCSVNFKNAGVSFKESIKHGIAGKSQIASFVILKDSTLADSETTNRCVPMFQNTTKSIDFWNTYVTPKASGTVTSHPLLLQTKQEDNSFLPAVLDNGAALQSGPAGTVPNNNTPHPIFFNHMGLATIQLAYPDAGQQVLNLHYDGSDATGDAGIALRAQTDPFTMRPYGLCVKTPNTCTGTANDNEPTLFNSCATASAGSRFDLILTPVAWSAGLEITDGAQPTPNSLTDTAIASALTVEQARQFNQALCDSYESGTPATPSFVYNNLPLTPRVIAPASGVNGTLGVPSMTVQGSTLITGESIDEAGVFEVSVGSASDTTLPYYSTTLPVTRSAPLGLFLPDYFKVETASVTNAQISNPPFTYMDQPGLGVSYFIGAYNLNDQLTSNYGLFDVTLLNSFEVGLVQATTDTEQTDLVSTADPRVTKGVENGNWEHGTFEGYNTSITYQRQAAGANSTDGPYRLNPTFVRSEGYAIPFKASNSGDTAWTGEIVLGHAAVDPSNALRLTRQGNVRFGRFWVEPELSTTLGNTVEIPFAVQYWDPNHSLADKGWVTDSGEDTTSAIYPLVSGLPADPVVECRYPLTTATHLEVPRQVVRQGKLFVSSTTTHKEPEPIRYWFLLGNAGDTSANNRAVDANFNCTAPLTAATSPEVPWLRFNWNGGNRYYDPSTLLRFHDVSGARDRKIIYRQNQ